jgi:hypothetical protein
METTKVSAKNSAGAIVAELVAIGATRVSMSYSENRRISGIDFTMTFGRLELPFSIPARIQALFDNKRFAPGIHPTRRNARWEAAERVAWRQLFRWVQAQAALIDTGMVTNIEVFTPYRMTADRRTLYEVMIENEMKALPPATEQSA